MPLTIELTPELEEAVSERAQQQGITPEHLALQELNRLFLEPVPRERDAAWKQLVHRYQSLVEKEFATGLTAEEAQECERLGAEIDAAETASESR